MCQYLKNYQGTFSCDSIKKPNFNFDISTYIFNLSKLDEKGTHLIAIQINNKNKKVTYFDSFGLKCTNKYLLSFIYSVNNKYEYSTMQIQHLNSIYCGIYCLAFVIHQDNANNFSNFLNMFNPDKLKQNDSIAVKYIIRQKKL